MIYFCLLLVFVYSLGRYYDLSMLAMSTDSPFWTIFTFPLLHTGFYHLVCNCGVLLSFWSVTDERKQAAMIVFLTMCMSYVCAMPVPTAGASGIATAMIGICIADLLHRGHYSEAMKLAAIVVSVIFVQAAFGEGLVNYWLHILSLIIALLCRIIWKSLGQIERELRG